MSNVGAHDAGSPEASVTAHYLGLIVSLLESTNTEQFSHDPQVADRLSLAIHKLRSPSFAQTPKLIFEILEREPTCAHAYVVWAVTLTMAGKLDNALCAFDLALTIDPTNVPALGGKMMLMALQGNVEGASREFRALGDALSFFPPDLATQFNLLLEQMELHGGDDIVYLNIGAGENFSLRHWQNLDSQAGDANPSPFDFGPQCAFPFENASFKIIHSSHFMEKFDDPTVDRMLEEALRVLKPGGALILKIPDFDRILEDWRSGNGNHPYDNRWNVENILPLWQKRGVGNTLHNRLAMLFCGFWNDEYANAHGSNTVDENIEDNAYYGPPVVDDVFLEGLIASETPHGISAALRQHVIDHEASYHFDHQNSWNREELSALLGSRGFQALSFDGETVMRRYHWIPEIARHADFSTFCFAVPA